MHGKREKEKESRWFLVILGSGDLDRAMKAAAALEGESWEKLGRAWHHIGRALALSACPFPSLIKACRSSLIIPLLNGQRPSAKHRYARMTCIRTSILCRGLVADRAQHSHCLLSIASTHSQFTNHREVCIPDRREQQRMVVRLVSIAKLGTTSGHFRVHRRDFFP